MYEARDNQVFYLHPENETEELFLTVHPTADSIITTAEQAAILANILNTRGRPTI